MHQTERYQLNLIESSDPFLPDGLNQNTRKVEEVLAAREALNDQILAQMDGRVTMLEAHRFIVGAYEGTGELTHFVHLGFTPIAVFVDGGQHPYFTIAGYGDNKLSIDEGGIWVSTYGTTNTPNTHPYLAFV